MAHLLTALRVAVGGCSRLLALGLVCILPGNLGAQGTSGERIRSRVELRLSALSFSSGHDGCERGVALAGGASIRSRGSTFLRGSLDLMGGGDPSCTFPPELASVGETTVFVAGVPRLRSSWRAGAWLGRDLAAGGFLFEPAVGLGLTRIRTLYLGRDKKRTSEPWVGARLTVRGQPNGIGAQVDLTTMRLPKRYYIPDVRQPGTGEFLRSFHAWNGTAELGVIVPWGAHRPRQGPAADVPVRLAVRAGLGGHDSGGSSCSEYTTIALGAYAESRGRAVIRGTLDVVQSARDGCDIQVVGPDGEPLPAIPSETTNQFAPRVGLWLGVRNESGTLDVAGGGAVSRSRTSYGDEYQRPDDTSWEPAIAIRGGVQPGDAALRLELTGGISRIRRRVVFLDGSDRSSLAHEWKPFFEVGLASALN